MTKFESWFIRRVFANEVRQGYDHDKRITALYSMVNDAVTHEFYEDNLPTTMWACKDWFVNSLKVMK